MHFELYSVSLYLLSKQTQFIYEKLQIYTTEIQIIKVWEPQLKLYCY